MDTKTYIPLLSDERFDEVILHDTASDRYMLRFYAKRVRDLYEADRKARMAELDRLRGMVEAGDAMHTYLGEHMKTVTGRANEDVHVLRDNWSNASTPKT